MRESAEQPRGGEADAEMFKSAPALGGKFEKYSNFLRHEQICPTFTSLRRFAIERVVITILLST